MRFLVDECLPQHLARLLAAEGHDVVHVCDLGLDGAPDEVVLGRAEQDERILVTADTDFGTLLALSGASRPSVILLRRPGRRSTERLHVILAVLDLVAEPLADGAVVTAEASRIRIRQLPIQR